MVNAFWRSTNIWHKDCYFVTDRIGQTGICQLQERKIANAEYKHNAGG